MHRRIRFVVLPKKTTTTTTKHEIMCVFSVQSVLKEENKKKKNRTVERNTAKTAIKRTAYKFYEAHNKLNMR